LRDEAAMSGDLVTARAAAAASFSVILAVIAWRARLKYSRLVAANARDVLSPARWPLISGTTERK
jgi:hypothetical protein